MVNTTVYLIRHSIRFDTKQIEKYNTSQNDLIKNEKIVLSVEGEKRAEKLAKLDELQNIDKVYASNCVRTLQTAKYLLANQNLPVSLDERFDERRVGIPNDDNYPNWRQLQYQDEDFKTNGGESQREVRKRFNEAFTEMLSENRGKRIVIFAHGYSITYFLMKYAKLENISEDGVLTLSFNGKIIFDKKIDAPEVFKLVLDEKDNVLDIENIEVKY